MPSTLLLVRAGVRNTPGGKFCQSTSHSSSCWFHGRSYNRAPEQCHILNLTHKDKIQVYAKVTERTCILRVTATVSRGIDERLVNIGDLVSVREGELPLHYQSESVLRRCSRQLKLTLNQIMKLKRIKLFFNSSTNSKQYRLSAYPFPILSLGAVVAVIKCSPSGDL